MPLTLIKGGFRILGTQPDGDSIRFYPDDPQAWVTTGIRARPNAFGGVQLRLDGIDALETHYVPPHSDSRLHQPAPLAGATSESLLHRLGFREVRRDEQGRVAEASPPAAPGLILTRFADTYGRPVTLVFPGSWSGPDADLASVRVDVELLRRSVNHGLLAGGLAYPTFYSQLYVDVRAELAAVAVAARSARAGVGAGRHPGRVHPAVANPAAGRAGDPAQAVPPARRIPGPRGVRVGGADPLRRLPRRTTTGCSPSRTGTPPAWTPCWTSASTPCGSPSPTEQIIFLEK